MLTISSSLVILILTFMVIMMSIMGIMITCNVKAIYRSNIFNENKIPNFYASNYGDLKNPNHNEKILFKILQTVTDGKRMTNLAIEDLVYRVEALEKKEEE